MITKITERSSSGEQATLCVLLSRLGYHPAKSSGEELLYKNVLHKFEKVPTLVVNSQLGLWFDRLTKRSGDLLDFGMAFWAELSPLEVSEKIGQLCGPFKDLQARADKQHTRKRRAVKIPHYHIGEIRQLGGNSEISDFLKSKGIWEIAIGHLKEVYYYVIDEKKGGRTFLLPDGKTKTVDGKSGDGITPVVLVLRERLLYLAMKTSWSFSAITRNILIGGMSLRLLMPVCLY